MGFKIDLQKEEALDNTKSYMLCPNHTSMIDVMVMLALAKKKLCGNANCVVSGPSNQPKPGILFLLICTRNKAVSPLPQP